MSKHSDVLEVADLFEIETDEESLYRRAAHGIRELYAENTELLQALQAAFKAFDAIYNEMTVGERYTNAGQYLIDAFPVVREALEKHGGE